MGMEQGRATAQRRELENALQAYSGGDASALPRINALNPEMGMRLEEMSQRRQQMTQEQAQRAIEQHRDRFIIGARLLEGVNDDAGYQRARAAAQQIGIDLSGIPATYDPQYVEQVRQIGRHLGGQQEGFTLGEGQVRYDASGHQIAAGPPTRPRYYPVAPGGRLELDPGYAGPTTDAAPQGAPVQVATPEQARQLAPGTEFITPDGRHLRVPGGPAPAAGPATFPRQ